MAINYETLFDLQGLAGLQNRIPPNVGMNLTGTPNINYLQNLANLAQQQQGPVLGPDDFGSYVIPASDPTYRTGFDYARSIAGGIPMSQVIAPGVSYSPEQPGGYTQAQLNTPVGTTPVEPPPPVQEPDIPSFLGTGIGGVRIPVDRTKLPPFRDIFGGVPMQPPVQTPPVIDIDAIRQQIAESGIDFTNLFGLPKYEIPDLSQFVRREDIPTLIPDVPTGRDFSVNREALIEDIRKGIDLPVYETPDLSQFVRREDIPSLIPSVPTGKDFSIDRDALIRDIREGIEIPKYEMPDLSQFARLEDIPKIPSREDFLSIAREGIEIPMPQQPDISKFVTQEDIQKAIAGIDMPTYQAPDLSAYDLRLAELEQQLAGLQQPTGGRFSISQPAPRGLI
jgi:hypothetical protein